MSHTDLANALGSQNCCRCTQSWEQLQGWVSFTDFLVRRPHARLRLMP